jgi:hypothetical protein
MVIPSNPIFMKVFFTHLLGESVMGQISAQNSLRIFLSYSRIDTHFVQTLYDRLRSLGHSIWLDTVDIKAGVR